MSLFLNNSIYVPIVFVRCIQENSCEISQLVSIRAFDQRTAQTTGAFGVRCIYSLGFLIDIEISE